jgi:hypothetical protein
MPDNFMEIHRAQIISLAARNAVIGCSFCFVAPIAAPDKNPN